MSNIIRARLHLNTIGVRLLALKDDLMRCVVIAEALTEEIAALEPLLVRKYTAPVAKRQSRALSPKLKEKMARDKLAHPDTPMRDIGQKYGVDAGRVSEAVAAYQKAHPNGPKKPDA